MLKAAGNFLWFILAGFWTGIGWWIAGVIMYVLIITIPWGRSAFVLGKFSFLPFGRTLINRSELTERKDVGTGKWGLVGNILWFLVAGLWLALYYIGTGIVLCITIIGIPFGIQCFKLAGASLAPIGKTVVSDEVAAEAKKRNAEKKLDEIRSKG